MQRCKMALASLEIWVRIGPLGSPLLHEDLGKGEGSGLHGSVPPFAAMARPAARRTTVAQSLADMYVGTG